MPALPAWPSCFCKGEGGLWRRVIAGQKPAPRRSLATPHMEAVPALPARPSSLAGRGTYRVYACPVALGNDLERVAGAAVALAEPGEQLVGLVAAEPAPGERTY